MRLFLAYPRFPEADRNAGALRVFEILRMLVAGGHSVTFLASGENEPKYRQALEDMGIECLCDADRAVVGNVDAFGSYLRERGFQVGVFVQHFIYNRYAPYFRMLLPDCRLVFDALDLEYVRCEREAQVLGTREARENANRIKREEHAVIRDADAIWTVTEVEKQTVLSITPDKHVDVIPTIHDVEANPTGFDDREGIVFLGNYQHRPNVNAINYFMKDIFPQVNQALPDVRFLIAGAYPAEDLYRHEKDWPNVKVTGYVEDHRALLMSCRVGIAPLRYGAGMKGKIGEYLCCGLPCVTSSVGSEGMFLTHETEVLVADNPGDFASSVIRLYSDRSLWEQMAKAGLAHMRQFSFDTVSSRVGAAIEAAASASTHRRSGRMANLSELLRRPGDMVRLIGTGSRAVRRGGWRELVKQFRVWLHRPPS